MLSVLNSEPGVEWVTYLDSDLFFFTSPEPIYEEMEGWSGTTAGARSWADLPAQAIKYVRRVEAV